MIVFTPDKWWIYLVKFFYIRQIMVDYLALIIFALKGEPISAVINAMTLILLEISVVLMP